MDFDHGDRFSRQRADHGGTAVFACHRPLAGSLIHRIKILFTEARFL
jgi:hypothetical protein